MEYAPDGLSRRYQNLEDYAPVYHCRRNNWRDLQFPTCNCFHERITLDRPPSSVADDDDTNNVNTNANANIQYTGHGYFRDSWIFTDKYDASEPSSFCLKSMRYKKYFEYDVSSYYQMHREAIVMERLTSSPRIVDLYGHCGTSILAEVMNHEVAADLVPNYGYGTNDYAGYMKQAELDTYQTVDVHPMNNLTLDRKLELAIVFAESIAEIHGFVGGVIIHGDIHPVQWLANTKGQVKLNDFSTYTLCIYVSGFSGRLYSTMLIWSYSSFVSSFCYMRHTCTNLHSACSLYQQTMEKFWSSTQRPMNIVESIDVLVVPIEVPRSFGAWTVRKEWIRTPWPIPFMFY
jgi:serine/threonine protein kinase